MMIHDIRDARLDRALREMHPATAPSRRLVARLERAADAFAQRRRRRQGVMRTVRAGALAASFLIGIVVERAGWIAPQEQKGAAFAAIELVAQLDTLIDTQNF